MAEMANFLSPVLCHNVFKITGKDGKDTEVGELSVLALLPGQVGR